MGILCGMARLSLRDELREMSAIICGDSKVDQEDVTCPAWECLGIPQEELERATGQTDVCLSLLDLHNLTMNKQHDMDAWFKLIFSY